MQTHSLYRVLAKRIREWNDGFREFVERLCREEIVIEAYLVGSRARGDNLPYSDYDVLVVVPDDLDKIEAAIKLRRLRRKSFPLDLIVLWASETADKVYAEMMRGAKKLC